MSQAAALPHALNVAEAPGKHVSLALTVAVHLALAVFLVYGINWQTNRPEAVEVELVSARPAPPPPRVQPRPEPKPESKPEPRVEEKRPTPVKPDIAVKEKEKPKPVKPEAPKPEPAPKPDRFQEQLRRDEERLAQHREADAATKELAQLKSAQASAARRSAESSYTDKIKGKIKGYIFPPPGATGHPELLFEVNQLPTGEILSVKLKKSSGNQALDAAVERAILRSSPLPLPNDPSIFQRVLELKFRPLDE